MTYATQQNMIDRFGSLELVQLTDRANVGSIDATVLGQALADADAEVDGYLSGRYTLPLATVPLAVTRIACDVARYHLYKDAATEQVSKRYDDAVKFLTMVGQGKLSLGLDTSQVPVPSTGGAQIAAGDAVFSGDKLSDY